MIDRKNINEFRETGLLLIINQILHIFGWAIVVETISEDNIIMYPARVKYRGFDNNSTNEAYKKISEYMKNNSDELLKESQI